VLELTLPIPPSINEIHRAIRGRNILSKTARIWYQESVRSIKQQAQGWFSNKRLFVCYRYSFKDSRRRDIGNYEKILSDSITKAGLWKDDSQIDKLTLIRLPTNKDCPQVYIEIEEVANAQL
jgi:crossover junction endodeoxyribonuclease RusA